MSSKYNKGYLDGYRIGYQEAIKECRNNIESMLNAKLKIESPINISKGIKTISMGFSERVLNILNRHEIYTIEELADKTFGQIIIMRGCGIGSVAEIREKLAKYGSHLRNE